MKVVRVSWLDACSYATEGWFPKEANDGESFKALPCVTAGMLYLEDDERIVVILNSNEHCISQAQTIPRGCITRIEVLEDEDNATSGN